jgi:hypothetical protein
MDVGSYERTAMVDTGPGSDPIARLVEAIRSLSNDNQLQEVQKPIATRYLAIRNAHGDFLAQDQPNAFFSCEVKKYDVQWKVTGAGLREGSTTIRLLKADGTKLIPDTAISNTATSFAINLDSEEVAKALALVEAYDTSKILLQLGIPKFIKP